MKMKLTQNIKPSQRSFAQFPTGSNKVSFFLNFDDDLKRANFIASVDRQLLVD